MNRDVARKCQVQGTVAPGFESVKALYEHCMNTLAEKNTQLCVYHKGQKVVDLWASTTGDSTFSADSLINVFSSGKSLESIAIASLVSAGLLAYDDKITKHWPEFGANGKEALTIAELMRHEGGLASFNTSIELEDLLTDRIKANSIGLIIEGHVQRFPRKSTSRREYHAVTRGWVVNEVFRRVDPAGRTIGEYLREDLSGPLGVDAYVGVKREELARVSRVVPLGFGWQFLESLKPRFMGRRIVHNIFQILGRLIRIIPALRRGSSMGAPAPFKGMRDIAFFNEEGVAMGETPSANANCTARALAKIAAMMSARGRLDGREYLTESAWQALHANPVTADMGGVFSTRFTQGGVNEFRACTAQSTKIEREFNEGREGFYGWMGLGGSIFQWHPELDIGFGFAPTSLHILDLLNERGKAYQAEVLRCVTALNGAAPTQIPAPDNHQKEPS
jgi:CubicO group peptidase (beta-lactamase class C family)